MKEIVLVMGYNASGKTTIAEGILNEHKSSIRVNRDTLGGGLSDMAKETERTLKAGTEKVVLDNTYPKKE